MTPFEMWCSYNGFDPKGEFVLTRSYGMFEAGEVVKAYYFYNSGEVLFIKSVGNVNTVCDVSFECLTQHKKEVEANQ